MSPLTSNEIEAANRAEATALLIRTGFRVYRPEADCYGEDLVVRDHDELLHAVQLKSRPTVDPKYGGDDRIWILFPEKGHPDGSPRTWFLVPHGQLHTWLKGHKVSFRNDGTWSSASISMQLGEFLEPFRLR